MVHFHVKVVTPCSYTKYFFKYSEVQVWGSLSPSLVLRRYESGLLLAVTTYGPSHQAPSFPSSWVVTPVYFSTRSLTLKEHSFTRLLKYYLAFPLLLVVHMATASLLSSRRSSSFAYLSLLVVGSKCCMRKVGIPTSIGTTASLP